MIAFVEAGGSQNLFCLIKEQVLPRCQDFFIESSYHLISWRKMLSAHLKLILIWSYLSNLPDFSGKNVATVHKYKCI